MGAKFSKSSKGEKKWDEMKLNGKSLPENFDKTSTLPASFRRRDEEVVMTGTLPRSLNRIRVSIQDLENPAKTGRPNEVSLTHAKLNKLKPNPRSQPNQAVSCLHKKRARINLLMLLQTYLRLSSQSRIFRHAH